MGGERRISYLKTGSPIFDLIAESVSTDFGGSRVEKSREHREHAPGTPKAFPRNTQGKKLSTWCSDSVSSHIICEKSLIYQYFPSSACSIVLWCPIVQNTEFVLPYNWRNIFRFYEKTQEQEDHQLLLPERLSTFFSSGWVAGWVVQWL